jgi:hypothetical protein
MIGWDDTHDDQSYDTALSSLISGPTSSWILGNRKLSTELKSILKLTCSAPAIWVRDKTVAKIGYLQAWD